MLLFLSIGIILFITLLLLVLALLNGQIMIDGNLSFHDINVIIKLKVMKITLFKMKLPKKTMGNKGKSQDKNNDDSPSQASEKGKFSMDKVNQWIDVADEVMESFDEQFETERSLLKLLTIKKLEWQTVVGLDEADLSALSTGVVWIIKSQILRFLSGYISLPSKTNVQVTPDFNGFQLSTTFSCMISFPIGKTILTAFRITKQWKGRKSEWENIQFKV